MKRYVDGHLVDLTADELARRALEEAAWEEIVEDRNRVKELVELRDDALESVIDNPEAEIVIDDFLESVSKRQDAPTAVKTYVSKKRPKEAGNGRT